MRRHPVRMVVDEPEPEGWPAFLLGLVFLAAVFLTLVYAPLLAAEPRLAYGALVAWVGFTILALLEERHRR